MSIATVFTFLLTSKMLLTISQLADKERRAIRILRMYRGDDPIEVSYSGGKDSDVILALTKMAGIPY